MKNFTILIITIFTLLTLGCTKKEDEIITVVPDVKTLAVTNVTINSATIGGQITKTGNVFIYQRGIVWSTNSNPTLGTNSTSIDTVEDLFTKNINSLNANTTYYVKAYLQLQNGSVVYGNEISFLTENYTKAVVVTGAITFDQINSLIVNAEVVSSTSPVSYRGICFGTTPNPTPSLNNGNGIGVYQIKFGSAPNRTLYIRAYAQNMAGLSYGNEIVYNTISNIFSLSDPINDRDGNTYPTFIINNQRWTQKNLNVSRFRNGDLIPQIQDRIAWLNATVPAWCYYENNTANGISFGKLYNHYAVTDPRGLAPIGWHIPSNLEARKLIYFMGEGSLTNGLDQYLNFSNNSGPFRQVGTTFWPSPNTNATNSSGFTALPGGSRNKMVGSPIDVSLFTSPEYIRASFWTSELFPNNPTNLPNAARSFAIGKSNDINSLSGIGGYGDRSDGMSVRCIKD